MGEVAVRAPVAPPDSEGRAELDQRLMAQSRKLNAQESLGMDLNAAWALEL